MKGTPRDRGRNARTVHAAALFAGLVVATSALAGPPAIALLPCRSDVSKGAIDPRIVANHALLEILREQRDVSVVGYPLAPYPLPEPPDDHPGIERWTKAPLELTLLVTSLALKTPPKFAVGTKPITATWQVTATIRERKTGAEIASESLTVTQEDVVPTFFFFHRTRRIRKAVDEAGLRKAVRVVTERVVGMALTSRR